MALTSDGATLYLSGSTNDNYVVSYDIATGAARLLDSTVGLFEIIALALNADNTVLYIAEQGSNEIFAYTIETGELSSVPIPGGYVNGPVALVFYQGEGDPYLYILNYNGGSSTVVSYDLMTTAVTMGSVDVYIPSGAAVGSMVFNPEPRDGHPGPFLYIANSTAQILGYSTIAAYDLTTQVTIQFPFEVPGESLTGLAIDLNTGPTLYMVGDTNDTSPSPIYTYVLGDMDYSTTEVTNAINPTCLALTPDSSTLYIGNTLSSSGDLAVVSYVIGNEMDEAELLVPATLFGEPYGLAFSPDGNTLYMANYGGSEGTNILTYDLATGAVSVLVGGLREPAGLAISPDGGTLYIADTQLNDVYSCNINDPSLVYLGGAPLASGLALSPDGNILYATATSREGGTIYTYVVNTGIFSPLITSGLDIPAGLALSSDGSTLYISDDGTNAIYYCDDLTAPSPAVQLLFDSGLHEPRGLALNQDNTVLYVANTDDNNVIAYDLISQTPTVLVDSQAPTFLTLFSIAPPLSLNGEQRKNDFGLQYELFNVLTWLPNSYYPTAGYYVYRNGVRIATLDANTLVYKDRNRPKGSVAEYTVTIFNSGGSEGASATIAVP